MVTCILHLQVDIEAVSGCNTVQYQLSTDIIENIFRTYPTGNIYYDNIVIYSCK